MKHKRVAIVAGMSALGFSLAAFAASSYIGTIDLVEQYAPGNSTTSGALCYVGVPAAAVSNKAACASSATRYYYAWDCDDPKRKNLLALAMASYVGEKKVQLVGSGQCSPHAVYENLDYFIVSESP